MTRFHLQLTLKYQDGMTSEDFVATLDSLVTMLNMDSNLEIESIGTDLNLKTLPSNNKKEEN